MLWFSLITRANSRKWKNGNWSRDQMASRQSPDRPEIKSRVANFALGSSESWNFENLMRTRFSVPDDDTIFSAYRLHRITGKALYSLWSYRQVAIITGSFLQFNGKWQPRWQRATIRPSQFSLANDTDTLSTLAKAIPTLRAAAECFSQKRQSKNGKQTDALVHRNHCDNYVLLWVIIYDSWSGFEAVIKNNSPDDMMIGMCMTRSNVPIVHMNNFHQAKTEEYRSLLLSVINYESYSMSHNLGLI